MKNSCVVKVNELSPARRALARHQERISALRSEVDRKAKPVTRLQKQLEEAKAAISDKHDQVTAIVEAARSGSVIPASKQDHPDIAAIEAALVECSRDLAAASAELSVANNDLDDYLIAVLQEEHAAVLERRETARKAFVEVDADAVALTTLFSEIGRAPINHDIRWLRAGENASAAVFEQKRAEPPYSMITAAKQNWASLLAALRGN